MRVEDAQELARRATIFGYALVEHYKALWAANSPQSPRRAPAYQYVFNPRLYGPEDDIAVTANNDTIYGGCALDLRAEPTVLKVPVIRDRYYSIQFISCSTDDFAHIGTRLTGTDAGIYLITGPDWHGDTPSGIKKVLPSPSRFALAPVRVAVTSAADLPNAAALQDRFTLMPLSQFLNQVAPPPPAPTIWPAFYDPRSGDLDGFLNILSYVMQWHEFSPVDRPALLELAELGVRSGHYCDRCGFPAAVWAALEAGFEDGRAIIAAKADNIGPTINGWSFSPRNAGHFGADYLTRAATAWKYIYVQPAEEAMYPTADVDSEGRQLDGATGEYTLEFPAGRLPPAKFFWSVTLYDKKNGLLVRNPISRYSIGDRTAGLKYEDDGGLKLSIQSNPPSEQVLTNWLPAPREGFYLCLRVYGPKADLLDGEYLIPPVCRRSE